MQKFLKYTLAILISSIILLSLPGYIQNRRNYLKLEAQVCRGLNTIDQVCDSDCTDYPHEWVKHGHEEKAVIYCLRQCANRDKMREDLVESYLPIEYANEYNLRIMQLYCALGLFCPPLELEELARRNSCNGD